MPVDCQRVFFLVQVEKFKFSVINFVLSVMLIFLMESLSKGIDIAYMQATAIRYENIWKKIEWNMYGFACGRNEITTGAYSNEIWIYIIRRKWAAHRLSVEHGFSNRIDSCATLFWVIPFHFDWVFAHFSRISAESLFASLWTLRRTRDSEQSKNTHTQSHTHTHTRYNIMCTNDVYCVLQYFAHLHFCRSLGRRQPFSKRFPITWKWSQSHRLWSDSIVPRAVNWSFEIVLRLHSYLYIEMATVLDYLFSNSCEYQIERTQENTRSLRDGGGKEMAQNNGKNNTNGTQKENGERAGKKLSAWQIDVEYIDWNI